jgi:predicted transcriptional regulator of viral defense system
MNPTIISLPQATSLALSTLKSPVVTAYQLGRTIFHVYLEGGIGEQRLEVKKPIPERRHFLQVLNFLLAHGVLHPVRGLPEGSVYTRPGVADPGAHELLCAVDPFAYLSHLSAMAVHGLTDRIPHTVFASSPAPREWRASAQEQMRKDLGDHVEDYLDSGLPVLHRTKFEKIVGQPVHLTQSSHLGAFKKLEPQGIRVSTIGRTFLDMLRNPDLCGGIQHVLDVYAQHAKVYLPLIVGEIQQHGKDIDKVRAGYILEERCGLASPAFADWLKSVARGGSRKLVGTQPYSATFSERWCLSLNVD